MQSDKEKEYLSLDPKQTTAADKANIAALFRKYNI